MSDRSENTALMMVLFATSGLALKGVFAKLAYAEDITVIMLVVLRFAMAVPLFWLGAKLVAKRGPFSVTLSEWRRCSLAGLLFFVATLSDFNALSLIDVGLSRAMLFTFPVWVMLIEAVRARELPEKRRIICIAIAYGGLLMMILPDGIASLWSQNWVGLGWGLSSAISYAVYLVAAQDTMKQMGSMRFTAASGTVTLAVCLVYFAFVATPTDMVLSVPGVGWVAVVAVATTVIPFFLLFEGINRIGAGKASIATLFGPPLTVLMAWLILDEVLTLVQGIGFALVLVGISLLKSDGPLEWLQKRVLRQP